MLKNGKFESLYIIDIKLTQEELNYIDSRYKDVYLEKNDEFTKIGYSGIIGDYHMDWLDSSLHINFPVTNKMVENIKYLKEGASLNFSLKSNNDNKNEDIINDVIKVVNRLKSLNMSNEVKIHFPLGLSVNSMNDLIAHLNKGVNGYNNISVQGKTGSMALSDFIKMKEIIMDLVRPVMNDNFSQLEKFLYFYDVVKQFKKYKENEDAILESREIQYILYNEYMVCVGFSKLLQEFLNIANIEYIERSIDVDVSYDEVNLTDDLKVEDKPVSTAGHARVFVHIKDEKYNIDNYFVTDPTWDNNMDVSTYFFALKPLSSERETKRMFMLTDLDKIFDVDAFDDYVLKINNYLDKCTHVICTDDSKCSEIDSLLSDVHERLGYQGGEKVSSAEAYESLVNYIMKKLIKLDYELYSKLEEEYNILLNNPTTERYNNFITRVGYEILNKTNKEIPDDHLFEAIYNMKHELDKNFTRDDLEVLRKVYVENIGAKFPYSSKSIK